MSEPYEPRTTEQTPTLTTEQLANAAASSPATGERRSFSGDDAATQRLLPEAEAAALRSSWDSIQAGFVDEPRRAVEDADQLVAQTMKRLAEMFAEERRGLESQWDRGDDVSTEDLRIALQRYRAFFGRLLAV